MSAQPGGDEDGPAVVSNRTMEIVTALLFLVVAAIVAYGSRQIGAGWRDDGPGPGFFPFYIALIMGAASIANLVAALRSAPGDGDGFVARAPLGRVLAVLVPSVLYVGLIGGIEIGSVHVPGLGLYLASLLFIFGFMLAIGREPVWKAGLVAVLVPLVTYVLFERWFKVALPKGPLEAWLGLA